METQNTKIPRKILGYLMAFAMVFLTTANTFAQDLYITTEVCGTTATDVKLTGPWWGWDPNAGPIAADNGDGTWTFTISPAPTADMEYLLVVDGVQENLIAEMVAGGSCAPVTDYANYANRLWIVGSGDVTNTYAYCGGCPVNAVYGCTDPNATNYDANADTDDGSCTYPVVDLNITTEVCAGATEVRMTGPWWNWDPIGGPIAVDNGNGTWTFTLSPAPTADMEYLLVVDGVQENLVAAPHPDIDGDGNGDLWGCAPITDYFSYANRQWVVGSGDVTGITYATCGTCADVYGCMDATASNYDAAANVNDQSVCTFAPPPAPMENLFFSEYAEGSSNNKYLEIYNPSANTVDLADYATANVSNAPTTLGVYEFWNAFDAGATIAPGGTYVVAHGSADAAILAYADMTFNYLSNGDDGYALVYGAEPASPVDPATGGYVILDMIGDWQGDPGSGWEVAGVSNGTQDHTLVRKCDVTAGNMSNWALSAGTDSLSSEWMVMANEDWTNLGSHTTPCVVPVLGCTDATACNYDAAADTDDGSCTYAAAGFDCAGNCLVGDLVTLNLYDSYGDGGGSVTVNGTTYTLLTGSSESWTFCMDLSVCTDIIYTSTDSWPYENSWDLVDASGNVVASGADANGIVGNVPGFDCAGNCLNGEIVTVTLYDSYGDGGGQLTVDGNILTNSGVSNSMTICLDLTTCTDVIYASTDSWPYENSWDIIDASGAIIASGADASGDVGACAVLGCIDATASNYDPLANTDDGSCIYCAGNYVDVTCGGGSFTGEVSWTLTNSSGTVVLTGGAGLFAAPFNSSVCLPDDCYTLDMVDSYGDGWNGNIFEISLGGISLGTATLATGSNGTADFSVGAVCAVLGCTDAAALNYDPLANTDDGSCSYTCTAAPYCETFDNGIGTWTNSGWVNDAGGTTSGSTGPSDDITGGSNYMYYETSAGYAPIVTMTSECLDITSLATPTLSFYNHMYGATIGTLNVLVNGTSVWSESGDQGNQWNWVQIDLSAYGPDVTITFEASYGGSFTGDIAIDNVCVDEFLVINGCTDPFALNYDAMANTDDGSCTYCPGTYLSLNMFDSFGDGWNGAEMTITGANGSVFGPYTIATGAAAVEMMCMDDDCYAIDLTAGSWASEISWNITDQAGTILASGGAPYNNQGALSVNVTCPVYGCNDPAALNFDSLATADDGSCTYLCDPYIATSQVDAVPSCNGAFDASATALITGSFGNDFWLWDDGTTSSTITGLAAGTYSCTITDSVNGCTSTTTVTIDPTPVITVNGTSFDATPGNADGGVVTATFGGTPCYNGAANSLAGVSNTTTQWASNAFDLIASSDLQLTSIDQPSMAGFGTANVWYRLGSGLGYEADPTGWMLAGTGTVMANVTGDMSNIPVTINMTAGDTICVYVQGVGVNVVFGAGVAPTYAQSIASDANLSILGGFATGGAPGAGTTLPSPGSYDFGGNLNYNLSSYTYVWSNGDSVASPTGLPLGPISVTVTDCNGCTASETFFILENYIYGCTDTLASNFDPAANTPDTIPSCLYDGCTDSLAVNYDATANNDDGSCFFNCAYYGWGNELTVTFTPDWFTSECSWYILDAFTGDTALSSPVYANGGAIDVQTWCVDDGCYYLHGYDSFGDGWGGGTGILDVTDAAGNAVGSLTLGSATTFNSALISVGAANCALGCTDTAYTNFDVNAAIDDGSCADTIVGCTDPLANNYTPFSNVDDGSCCYDNFVSITCDGGSWQSEVSWDLIDGAGNIVLSGGAPFATDLCLADDCYTLDMVDSFGDGWNGNNFVMFDASGNAILIATIATGTNGTDEVGVGVTCPVFGCTDPLAVNYDPNANTDDGSCLASCTAAPYCENFDAGVPADWVNNGWTLDALGTGSGGTGPSDDITGGGNYMYYETSPTSTWGASVTLTSLCLDISTLATPSLSFYNHMFGASMGTLEVLVNGTVEWSMSGNQGDQWNFAQVDLAAYAGNTNITIDFVGTGGTSFTGDMAIDEVCVDELLIIDGCTDPMALNFDPAANNDDGSCAYCTGNWVTLNMYDSFGDGWNGATYLITDAFTGDTAAIGGLGSGAFELGTVCINDGCYIITVGGGTFDSEITFDFDTTLVGAVAGTYNVTVGNATCLTGCMDPVACNYDATATIDDGTCESISCYGCMDPAAFNYDATMTYDDGSCLYCSLTSSGIVTNDTGAGDGSIDFTVDNSYCVTTTDLFVSVAGGNGQNGNAFNIINTSGSPLYIDGFSQGPGSGNIAVIGAVVEVFCAYGDYMVGTPSWTSVASATVDLTPSLTTGYVQIAGGITIPAGGTYGFWVGRSDGGTVQYTNGTGTVGVSPWSSDANMTVTEGHGGTYPTGLNFSPRNWNGTVHYGDPLAVTSTYVWSNGATTEDVDSLAAGTYTVTATDCYGCTVTETFTVIVSIDPGCTDPLAFNYDPTANTDDGSCVPFINGCTDPLAVNYDATANTDDGSCNYCTDNSLFITVGGGSWQGEVSWTITASDGITVVASGGAPYSAAACLVDDCYTVDMVDSFGDGWNGNVIDITDAAGNLIATGTLATGTNGSFTFALGTGVCPTPGCTDPMAANYDPNATIDDGSCDYLGCTNPTATNFDPMATIDDGSCTFGCTENTIVITAGGGLYTSEVSWTILDGAGNVVLSGGAPYASTECLPDDCYTVDMFDSYGDGWNGNTIDFADGAGNLIVSDGLTSGAAGSFTVQIGTSVSCAVLGCTDPNASNFDATATQDDGSCTYPCLLDEVTLTLSDSYGDGWNGNTLTVDGVDYTQSYTSFGSPNDELFIICIDLSTCIDVVYNALGTYAYENSWTITDASGTVLASGDNTSGTVTVGTCAVLGCTDATAFNYDPAATVDDGSCIATVYGCTDASQSNYDPAANVDDGSCIPVVLGCTDPAAVNYNATVNTDDGSCLYSGCTDPLASNYDANATIDDGSCSYGPSLCAGSAITGLSVSDIIHDRATFNFDNMNTYDATGAQVCRVDQIRIKYRPVGTSSWSQKNMAQPTGYDAVTGICNSTQNTAKITRNLMSSTTYEWEVKVWYCDGQNTGFVSGPDFTTADDCPNVGNLTAVGANPTMATFAWDNSNGAYSFVRLKARVDSISNPTGSDFFQIGGSGVSYGIYTKNKQNMVPGETYRGQARTYCDPNGGPYRSPSWSPLVFWTQPTVRIEGGVSIANLDVYPNPSRDVFNVAFTSEDVQDLEVRVINVVGEVVYTENLQQFVGEYTKLIDLAENTKGVYFLEITTNTGVVNKKLMLQ